MNQIAHKNTPEQAVEAIFALNFDQIKSKLMHETEGYGWTQQQADQSEVEYKRYLVLLIKYPEETIVPSVYADKFWHGHILDTIKYAEDCDNIFGHFLHHYPYFGLRGEQDAANQTVAADTMRRLYEKEFGQPKAVGKAAYCGKAAANADQDAAYCGRANVSYCGKVSDKLVAAPEQDVAYCGRASVSYCGKASDTVKSASNQDAAYCGRASVSYCGKASDQVVAKEQDNVAYCGIADVSYCGRASDKIGISSDQQAAYCGIAATGK